MSGLKGTPRNWPASITKRGIISLRVEQTRHHLHSFFCLLTFQGGPAGDRLSPTDSRESAHERRPVCKTLLKPGRIRWAQLLSHGPPRPARTASARRSIDSSFGQRCPQTLSAVSDTGEQAGQAGRRGQRISLRLNHSDDCCLWGNFILFLGGGESRLLVGAMLVFPHKTRQRSFA